MNVGIGLALLCAAITQLGFLCKHRGATEAARVDLRAPLRSARDLFRSKWFAIGMAIAAGAWILHVAALALAPLSVVQVALSTGVVMLAVLGERLFGCHVGGRQWVGVIMTSVGLTLLVITLPRTGGSHSAFAVPALIAFQAGMLALAGGVLLAVQILAFALVAVAALVTPHGRPLPA